jgi:hypothetical protein
MWWDRSGTLNLPPVMCSVPTKSPRQKETIASGAAQAATVYPLKRQTSQAATEATSPTPPIQTAVCPIRPYARYQYAE